MNATIGNLSANAMDSITNNSYNGFNMVNISPILIGAVVIFSIITILATKPEIIGKVILGYFALTCVSSALFLLYGVLMSMREIGSLVGGVLNSIGLFVMEYWLILGLSIPLAYYTGNKVSEIQLADEVKDSEE